MISSLDRNNVTTLNPNQTRQSLSLSASQQPIQMPASQLVRFVAKHSVLI